MCNWEQPCGSFRQLDPVITAARGVDTYRCMNGHNLTPPAPVEMPPPRVTPRVTPRESEEKRDMEKRKCAGCGAPGRRRDSCPTCTKKGDEPATAKKPEAKALRKTVKPARKLKKKPRVKRGPTPKREGLPSFESALTFLETQIESAEERLAKLKAARDGMAMLVAIR